MNEQRLVRGLGSRESTTLVVGGIIGVSGDPARAWRLVEPHDWPGDQASRLQHPARIAAVFGDLDRALADQSSALELGMSSFAWRHESCHHEFALMRQDPRIRRLLAPIELGS